MQRLLFTLLLLTVAMPATRLSSAAERPNVLVILADDLGYGDLGCYGAKDLRTPRLDQLAAEGQRFSHFCANSSVCSPTRAALLTGRYPELVGVPGVIRTHAEDSWGYLAPNAVLLPQPLKAAGYHTAIVGKWHLGLTAPNTPNDRGFDEFHGFLGDMMDSYTTHRRHDVNYLRHNRETIDPPGHATELFSDWACDYLRQRAGQKQPFFLYLAYNAPHGPLEPPAEWYARVKAREPNMSDKRAGLAALIEQMDAGIGRVLDTLQSAGLDQNTLVIFSSDNGGDKISDASNGATRDYKGSMYEGGLRVPTFARWPGHVRAGSQCDARAVTMDLFPTVLAAAGASAPAPIDGVNLLPLLEGSTTSLAPRDLFFIRREGGVPFGGKTSDALVRGRWKLLQNTPFTPQELYDLEADPLETTNLVDKEKSVFRELAAALRAQVQRGGAIPWQPPMTVDR
jgi:arylsulfatase A-like enzyme